MNRVDHNTDIYHSMNGQIPFAVIATTLVQCEMAISSANKSLAVAEQ